MKLSIKETMKYNDNELIYYIKEGNSDDGNILYEKYYPFIKSLVSKMAKVCKNSALEENDLYQEGMIGLINAINNYDESKDNKFYTYAKACIEKNIISAIVSANRKKHKIMNESILIDDANIPLFQTSSSQDKLIDAYEEREMLEQIRNNLTDFEEQVLLLRLGGLANDEIGQILDSNLKSVQNALQRIRTKTKKILNK